MPTICGKHLLFLCSEVLIRVLSACKENMGEPRLWAGLHQISSVSGCSGIVSTFVSFDFFLYCSSVWAYSIHKATHNEKLVSLFLFCTDKLRHFLFKVHFTLTDSPTIIKMIVTWMVVAWSSWSHRVHVKINAVGFPLWLLDPHWFWACPKPM